MAARMLALLAAALFLIAPLAPASTMDNREPMLPVMAGVEGQDPQVQATALDALLAGMGRSFTENRGQLDDQQVRFYAVGDPLSVAFERGKVTFSYRSPEAAFDFSMLVGDVNDVEPVGVEPLERSLNIFLGSDPEGWVSHIRSYRRVLYPGIYDGVDLRFRFEGGLLKYDLLVGAGVDPGPISMAYEGLDGIGLDPVTGELELTSGPVTLLDARPLVLQEGLGNSGFADGDYLLSGPSSVRYRLPTGLRPSLPFVIDPGLEFSTLVGKNESEYLDCCEVDPDGNIVLAGYADNVSLPLTPGAYMSDENLSLKQNVAVVKMDPTLSNVIFTSIIGGTSHDWARDLEVGPDGRIYLVGAASDDFPLTTDAFDRDNEDNDDAFLAVLSEDGSDLLYSGYIGGKDMEEARFCHLYDDGSVLVFGVTNSSDMPTTPGAYCETYVRAFPNDDPTLDSLFLAKLPPTRDRVEFCSYVNGFSSSSIEGGIACIYVDSSDDIYLATSTDWPEFPVTSRALFDEYQGGTDCALMKFDPNCTTLLYSTFLGGGQVDVPSCIGVDGQGRPWVVGVTHSADFPTWKPYQQQLTASGAGFVSVLKKDFSKLDYSTFFGGSIYTSLDVIRLDEDADRYYLLGGTSALDLPVTDGCFDPVYPGSGDPFVAVFNMTSHGLEYCSYLGGSGEESVFQRSMTLDGKGNMIVSGLTRSQDFPTTFGAFMSVRNGTQDAFALVLDPSPLGVPSPPTGVILEPRDGSVRVSWGPPGFDEGRIIGHKVYRALKGGNLSHLADVMIDRDFFIDRTVVNGVEYIYGVSAINSAGEGPTSVPLEVMPSARPDPPTDLVATTGDGKVTLTWTAPQDSGGPEILGYHLYRADAGNEPVLYKTLGNVTRFTDVDVVRGDGYVYALSSFTVVGDSTLTTEVQIVAEGRPDPPRLFSLQADDHRIVLSWGPPANDGGRAIEHYQIFRGTNPGSLSLLIEIGPEETDHIDTGLGNGVPYYYRMRAINAHGPGLNTSILMESPAGLPDPPQDLKATPSNGTVTLTWSEPDDNGGSPIIGYKVYKGTSPYSVALYTELGTELAFIDIGLTNGVSLNYAVSAVSAVGEGETTPVVETTPLGVPGPPTHLNASNAVNAVLLSWERPAYKGGATNLTYRILRGDSPDSLVLIDEVHDEESYMDYDVSTSEVYHYAVRTVNPIGDVSERTPVVTITAMLGAGPPTDLAAKRGDGTVLLTWSPPTDDGGSPVTGYIVYQGLTETGLEEVARPGNVLSHTVRSLENGRTYFFAVAALTGLGPGLSSMAVSTTPVPVPGAPQELTVRYVGDTVKLEWLGPTAGDNAAVTGYRVYRRTEGTQMELLVELGPVLEHTDTTVEHGHVYYYSVAAISDVGEGAWSATEQVSTESSSLTAWILLALALVIAGVLGAVFVRRRRPLDEGEVELIPVSATDTGAPVNIIEEVYLVYGDGRLIASCSREECMTQDADLTSSMLIAIQGMVQEGLEKGGELESIKSGVNIVMMERGVHLNLAVVLYGRPDDDLKEELESTVAQIEGTYAGMVEDWSGDRSVFEGVEPILQGLVERTAHLSREDLDRAMARYQVSLLSALDLYRGYVRLKVAALNATPDSVVDASIEVRFDPAMLRLERVEPDTFELRGDTVELGNVKVGEKRTVSFLFDPLICQETYIDGTISYHDARGDLQHTSMKRRQAKVVCPIFFTKEHASTGTLLRLVSEELDTRDSRVFRFPNNIEPHDALLAGKQAIGGIGVTLVREFEDRGPPFEAEVWCYGETKVKGYRLVVRLRVLEEDRLLELFAASTDPEPVAGLLAEFRRELLKVLQERHGVRSVEEIGQEDDLRRTLEERELLIRQ